jgi:hypothetical protein
MPGEPGLAGVEGIGELAHAPFAVEQQLDDLEADGIREGVKERGSAGDVERERGGHGSNISRNLDQ